MKLEQAGPTCILLLAGVAVGLIAGGGGGAIAQGPNNAAAQLTSLEARAAALEEKSAHFSRSGDEVTLTGANLYIVNGRGSTAAVNGLGNLILGYNELRDDGVNFRTGSHNLIAGWRNNYTSYGGAVFGLFDRAIAPYGAAVGGAGNCACGDHTVLTGGREGRGWVSYGSVTGGIGNEVNGPYSVVSGGQSWRTSEPHNWKGGSLSQPQ